MSSKLKGYIIPVFVLIFCLFASFAIFKFSQQKTDYYMQQDIFEHYKVSNLILQNKNPYLAILTSDMQRNNKYPTYFAGFYYLIMPTVAIFSDFNYWIKLWQIICILLYASIGFLIFHNAQKHNNAQLGFALAVIWLFNRWSLYLATTLSADLIAILLLIISLIIINTKQKTSLLIYGTQLVIKHLSLFLLPLYVLHNAKLNLKNIIKNTSLIIAPILLISLQFLIISPIAYLQSVLFSATRFADSHFKVISLSVGEIFNLQGVYERLPMLIAIFVIYYLFAKRKINFELSTVLVLLISITFNPVFFLQYESWFIAILLLYLPKLKT